MKIGALILNWQNYEDTLATLHSLNSLESPVPLRIMVVDDASPNASAEALRAFDSKFDYHIVVNEENKGTTISLNVGLRKLLSDESVTHIWFLDHDLEFGPEILNPLIAKFENDAHDVAYTIAYKELECLNIHSFGGYISPWTCRAGDISREVPDHKLDYFGFASILFARSAIESVGEFDETFFIYWSDVDYSLRMKSAGLRCVPCLDSKCFHKESSTKKKYYHPKVYPDSVISRIYFFDKHYSNRLISMILVTFYELVKIILWRSDGSFAELFSALLQVPKVQRTK